MLILAVPRPRLPPPEPESLSAPEPLAKDWCRRPEGSDKSPVSGGAGRLGVDLYPLRTLRPVRKPPSSAEVSVLGRSQECSAWPRSLGCFSPSRGAALEAILRLARHRPLSKCEQNGGERLAFHFLCVWERGRRQDFLRASLDSLVSLRMSTPRRGAAGVAGEESRARGGPGARRGAQVRGRSPRC